MPLPNPGDPDQSPLRTGKPTRMYAWVHLRLGRVGRKLMRYIKLQGEVLSIHESQDRLPELQLDVSALELDFSDRPKKTLRCANGRQLYTFYFDMPEVAASWANALLQASVHHFDRFYELGTLIGEGTYSRVYTAYDIDDRTKAFAVKIVKKRPNDVQALQWLERERHVNSVLNHPAIVQAVDIFSTVEKDFIVLEYMRGGTLRNFLRKHPRLPESYARVVMRELLTALNHIHSKNIVHRDVRPENIFCSGTRFPMSFALGDFGNANFVHDDFVNRDVLTTMIGLPPYISIDICRRIKYGPLSDMWSAGVVLYELLSGQVPFVARTDRDVVEKIKRGVVKFDNPIWKNISADAKGLVLQLMQVDPYKRVSAFAALQHRWIQSTNQSTNPSRTGSINTSCPTSPTTLGFGDRDSPGNTSIDSRRQNPPSSSVSNFSRNVSSNSSQSPTEADRSESSERQTSLLGQQPTLSQQSSYGFQSSMRSLHHVSSTSSLGGAQPRLQMTPSIRLITERGLQRVASDNPARMKKLMGSSVIQKQLSAALPYRRKLVVTARAFVAVFRMRAMTKGHCATRQLSLLGKGDVDEVNNMIDKRKADLEQAKLERNRSKMDRSTGSALPAPPRRGHRRQRSREVASHIIGRLSIDRKPHVT